MVSYFQVIMMAQINTSYSKSLVCGSQQCAAVFDVMWRIFLLYIADSYQGEEGKPHPYFSLGGGVVLLYM